PPDHSLNLPTVPALRLARTRPIRVLERGLELEPRHVGLLSFREKLGVRQDPVLSFLPRGHAINRWLGKRRCSLSRPSQAD
ncbi:MAG: hypothetical protein AAF533_27345, partial [Acidobacteriota bacterium]